VADVVFEHVTKVFPGGAVAVADLSLEVGDGEFLILVGPSGCGKTTALRMVAGLERISAGQIRIGGRVVNDLPPKERDVAMVFQSYALYPHMSVERNLAFGLRQRKTAKTEIERRVADVSDMLGLAELLQRRPGQLSGGQRQRVAMGRALVREPEAFLLDEPLSNLDAKLRVQMRAELKRLHARLGITTIYVTHDQVEAMTLGDRIAVLSDGALQQLGPPQEVYERPANVFVAGFVGSPPMNLLRAVAAGGSITMGELVLPALGVPGGEVVLGLRPESFVPAAEGLPGFTFQVEVVEPLGDEIVVHGWVAGEAWQTPGLDGEVLLADREEGGRAQITVRFAPSDRPAVGQRVRLGAPPGSAYLFDAATGRALG